MEQKDYILREIEKIGLMLRMLIDRLKLIRPNEQEASEAHVKESVQMILEEIGFDLERYLELGEDEDHDYLIKLKGFSVPNLELLADLVSVLGKETGKEQGTDYLKGALKLYESCTCLDRTYSTEREEKIRDTRNFMN
jgi:hypothetical protein